MFVIKTRYKNIVKVEDVLLVHEKSFMKMVGKIIMLVKNGIKKLKRKYLILLRVKK
jgi:hypothetical protein